jgi:tRNA uridine 5-carboxymethylaminomethyl modification enzyme
MAAAADEAGIHFRILNGSKGPAVRATRAQADRALYKAAIRKRLESQPRLSLFQAACEDLIVEGDRIRGVVTQVGVRFDATCVVLTAGTFLDGRIHIGLDSHAGGRSGEAPAKMLSARLKELKLPQGRLKTGTPPRLDGRTIDYSRLVEQPGDGVGPGCGVDDVPVFSFVGDPRQHPRQVSCWITQTNSRTHEIVRAGFSQSPMFTGLIEGVGPRYCPSIEDKVNRFAGKDSHQVFLEPEGLSTHEVYPNGISTSLPFSVQIEAVRSIAGLESAHIVRPGYAIEYDFFDPRALAPSFETRAIDGLFFAGQINGTTGYEEAAAQGLHAGLNAALKSCGEAPWVPTRDQAYLGVLIDDLVSKGVTEPYRMFTSRAEYRLQLREDNADVRLTEIGRRLGLVDDERWATFSRKRELVSRETTRLRATRVAFASDKSGASASRTLLDLLRRPGVSWDSVVAADTSPPGPVSRETLRAEAGRQLADQVIDQIETTTRYSGYVEKQQAAVERSAKSESTLIPTDLDFGAIRALSFEARQSLSARRPASIGAAARLPGMTPAAMSLLLVHVRKHQRARDAGRPSTPSSADA